MGRHELLLSLWQELEGRSLLLSGPRRIGKTELLKDMVKNPHADWIAVRVDVEGLNTPEGAVSRITATLRQSGLLRDGLSSAAKRLEELNLAGVAVKLQQAGEVDPWAVLAEILLNVLGGLPEGKRLLLALDEVPWLLDGIRQTRGIEEARRALASLRYLRQREDLGRFRMLLTGSIGLAGLARALGASAELNDLTPSVEVPPLSPVAGQSLFEVELTGRSQTCSPEAAAHAHEQAGGSPHWIKVFAARLTRRPDGAPATAEDVEHAIRELLHPRMRDLFDDEGREHLIKRHGLDKAKRMVAILDAADADTDVPEHVLIGAAMVGIEVPARRAVRELVHTLVDEHYLTVDLAQDPPTYRFVSPLFRRWWQRFGGAL